MNSSSISTAPGVQSSTVLVNSQVSQPSWQQAKSGNDYLQASLSIAELNRTLKLFSGGYSVTALVAKTVEAEVNTKGPGKKNAAVEGDEGKRTLVSEVVVATPRVKPLVLRRVSTEKYRGTEGEAFVCLG